jgi:hypothetical protein
MDQPTAAVFLEAADELILSVICTLLDLPSLRAIAQALRASRHLAAQELLVRVMERLARTEPDSTAAGNMLQRMKLFDSKSTAKYAPVMLELIFERPEPKVR